jgi:NADH dehydrogenase
LPGSRSLTHYREDTMTHIVILGGGYGGIEVVKQLLKKEARSPFSITLIDKHPFHSIKTEFYALASGTIADDKTRLPFPEHPLLTKVYDEIVEINLKEQRVFTNKKEFIYDYLIIATGAEDRFPRIKGAKEYSKSIQTIEHTRKTYEGIQNTRPYGTIKIIGGGLTGVELASELRESRTDLNIHLYERGNKVLKQFSGRIQNHVMDWFKTHDVKVISHSSIDYLGSKNIYNNGKREEADLIIWAAGVQPTSIVRNLDLEKDFSGRLRIDRFHRVINHPNVFAIGDCSSTPYPPSAQIAKQQGRQVAAFLIHLMNNKYLTKGHHLIYKGTLGTLGKKDGFGEIGNRAFTGKLPRFLKKGVGWLHHKQ